MLLAFKQFNAVGYNKEVYSTFKNAEPPSDTIIKIKLLIKKSIKKNVSAEK